MIRKNFQDQVARTEISLSVAKNWLNALGIKTRDPVVVTNIVAYINQMRVQMTGNGYLPKIVLCLLGDAYWWHRHILVDDVQRQLALRTRHPDETPLVMTVNPHSPFVSRPCRVT